jgi:hypothetical protein
MIAPMSTNNYPTTIFGIIALGYIRSTHCTYGLNRHAGTYLKIQFSKIYKNEHTVYSIFNSSTLNKSFSATADQIYVKLSTWNRPLVVEIEVFKVGELKIEYTVFFYLKLQSNMFDFKHFINFKLTKLNAT